MSSHKIMRNITIINTVSINAHNISYVNYHPFYYIKPVHSSYNPLSHRILWPHSINHSRKRYRLPNMFQTAQPCDCSFESESKTRMRHRTIFPQIKIPVYIFNRKFFFFYFFHESLIIVLTLAATYDFIITFRCKHITAQGNVFVVRIIFHIKSLAGRWIVFNDHRLFEML